MPAKEHWIPARVANWPTEQALSRGLPAPLVEDWGLLVGSSVCI